MTCSIHACRRASQDVSEQAMTNHRVANVVDQHRSIFRVI